MSPIHFLNVIINSENCGRFVHDIGNTCWNVVDDDPNIAYNHFIQKCLSIYNNCFPVKRVVVKKKIKHKPWFTKSLRKLCNKKCLLYKKYISNPSDYRHVKYKQFRNKVIEEIKKAKKDYFKNKFISAAGNLKNTWNIINSMLGTGSRKNALPSSVKCNDKSVTGQDAICSAFNQYFIDIGPTLASTCKLSGDHTSNIKRNNLCAFFKPCTPKEIIDIVCNFKNGKSPGYDDIDTIPVKKVIHILCFPLCAIFNLSLAMGTVLDNLKIAKLFLFIKMEQKKMCQIIDQYLYFPYFRKFLKNVFLID